MYSNTVFYETGCNDTPQQLICVASDDDATTIYCPIHCRVYQKIEFVPASMNEAAAKDCTVYDDNEKHEFGTLTLWRDGKEMASIDYKDSMPNPVFIVQ